VAHQRPGRLPAGREDDRRGRGAAQKGRQAEAEVERTGLIATLARILDDAVRASPSGAAWGTGILTALACNLMNNLPVGLIAGSVLAHHSSTTIAGAALIGVDLGPNLSVTGSLATILWLVAVRREGHDVGTWRFLGLGFVVMPPALTWRSGR